MTAAVRLATGNAASGVDRRTGRTGIARWARAVAGLDVDVVAVQEVDHLLDRTGRADQVAEVAEVLAGTGSPWTARFAAAVEGTPGSARTMRPSRSSRPGVPAYGVGLVSRHPVDGWRELRMPPSRAWLPVPLPPGAGRRVLWVPDEQRVALAGVVRTPGGPLTVVCTHLSFAPHHAVRQLRQLCRWAGSLPRPLVLLGDLNLPGPWPARITGWAPLVRAATFPAARPAVQLDHALFDGACVPFRGAVHRVAGSDHLLVRAELVLDEAAGLNRA